jgi:hypothetical protein
MLPKRRTVHAYVGDISIDAATLTGTAHAKSDLELLEWRCTVGGKPSNNFQMDRPESGGADRKEEREASGLLDQEKQEFAEAQTRKKAGDEQNSVGKRSASGQGKRSAKRTRGPIVR